MKKLKGRQAPKDINKRQGYFILVVFALAVAALLFLVSRPVSKPAAQSTASTGALGIDNSQAPGSVGLASNQASQNTISASSNTVYPSNYIRVANLEPSDIDVNELLILTNQQRAKVGAGTLTMNAKLTLSAQNKCQDMVSKNYWSHNSPDGAAPWVFVQNQGYYYRKLGENLAAGYDDAQATINGWMNSPEHKANLLDPAFTDVGFAVCKSDKFVGTNNFLPSLIVVQHLGKPS